MRLKIRHLLLIYIEMIFLGSPYPITKHPLGFFHTNNGIDQVKADLLVLLLTNPGERCLTRDTQISLANGTEVPIKELVGKEAFWVYSYDHNSNSVVPGKATAHKTIDNAELIEITLDNEQKVRCTLNHLWLLRDGSYKRADELSIGDSLMPLYRNLNTSKYERVYQPYLENYRETHLCFVFEKRLTGIREVVHHKDLNKYNNSPDNLQWMTCQDHIDLHKEIRNIFNNKINSDPEFKEKWILSVKEGLKKYYETHDGPRKGAILSEDTKKKLSDSKIEYFKTEEGLKAKEFLREKALKYHEENDNPMKGKKHTEETKIKMRKPRPSIMGENNPAKRPEVREKLRLEQIKRREKKAKEKENKNHKVLSIKKLEEREDCYDLHVEQYHNFALTAGVFVHNCMLPSYGTPLRTLFFEPNDAALAEQARQMIINSITKWEPRITVNQIEVSNTIDTSSLNPADTQDNLEHILSIKIRFFDPENIKDVQELKLKIPLARGGS